MKSKGRFIAIVLALAFAALIGVLPTLLASGPAIRVLLPALNKRIPGKVAVERVRLGWMTAPRFEGLTYSDPQRGILVRVEQLIGSQGLLALLAAPKNLGTVTVRTPSVDLAVEPAAQTSQGKQTAISQAPDTKPPQSEQKERLEEPFWEGMLLSLRVEEGVVRARSKEKSEERILASAISSEMTLRGGSAEYRLQLVSGAGGEIQGQGQVNLPAHSAAFLETVVARGNFDLKAMNGSPLLDFLSSRGTIPTGTLIADGGLKYTISGLDDVSLQGAIHLTDVALLGGALKTDTPRFESIKLAVDLGRSSTTGWDIRQLQVDSEPVQLRASGRYDRQAGRFDVEGELNVPALASQIPATLGLRQGTHVNGGRATVKTTIEVGGTGIALDARSTVEGIAGSYQDKSFIWSDPVNLHLQAAKQGEALEIGDFTFDSAFCNLAGRGTAQTFALEGSADLERMSAELVQLFPLRWQAGGKMTLAASTVSADSRTYQLTTKASIADFTVAHENQTVLPAHQFSLDGKATFPLSWISGEGSMDLRAEARTYGGEMVLEGRRISRQNKQVRGGFSLTADLTLGPLSSLLRGFGVVPSGTTVDGNLALAVGGSMEQTQVLFHQWDMKLAGLRLDMGDVHYADPLITLSLESLPEQRTKPVHVRDLVTVERRGDKGVIGSGLSGIDVAERRLLLRNLSHTSRLLQIDSGTLRLDDWQDPMATLQVDSDLSANLAMVTATLHDLGRLDKRISIEGQGQAVLHLRQTSNGQRAELVCNLARTTLQRNDAKILVEEAIEAVITADGNLFHGESDLELSLKSTPLRGSAKGTLQRGEQGQLVVDGTLTPDLAAVAPMVNALAGKEIRMAGKGDWPFSLALPLDPSRRRTDLRFQATLAADTIGIQDLVLDGLAMPVTMDQGLLTADITGRVGNGALALQPECDLNKKPPQLHHPDNVQVLTDVELIGPLGNEVLARIHPLFGILAKPSGIVSVRLDSFAWPLSPTGSEEARFASTMDISKVTLDNRGILQEVLGLMQMGDEDLVLQDASVTCTGENGRVACSPVHVLIAESEMVVSGSVGLDKTIDYLLEIPVTKKLVGTEGYRILEGATIKVPIKGTLGQPIFNRSLVETAVADLLEQAAGNVIQKQVEKVLPGLLDKLMGQ